MIRALLLDADGVFQKTGAAFWPSLEKLHPGGDARALAEAIFKVEDACLDGSADFAHVVRDVLARHNSTASPHDVIAIWHQIEVDEAILSLVRSVRASGLVCCVASNQQAYRARHMSEVLGYAQHFDREFYSHRLGFAKPKDGYYRALLSSLGMSPQEVLFIDDREVNVSAAAGIGMHSEWFPANAGSVALAEIVRKHGIHVDV